MELRNGLLKLQATKEANISEAEILLEVLNSPSNGSVGISGPLVDCEGFPRADIDIMLIRTHRNRLACLRTDRKMAEKQIHELLIKIHEMEKEEVIANPSFQKEDTNPLFQKQEMLGNPSLHAPSEIPKSIYNDDLNPFAIIDLVSENSPAAAAGLLIGDKLVRFGTICHVTGSKQPLLSDLATVANQNVNRDIRVGVLRNGTRLEITLQPKQWEGRGTLGCHIVPI